MFRAFFFSRNLNRNASANSRPAAATAPLMSSIDDSSEQRLQVQPCYVRHIYLFVMPLQIQAATLSQSKDFNVPFPLPVKGGLVIHPRNFIKHPSLKYVFFTFLPIAIVTRSPCAIIIEGLAAKEGHFFSAAPKQVWGSGLKGSVSGTGCMDHITVFSRHFLPTTRRQRHFVLRIEDNWHPSLYE